MKKTLLILVFIFITAMLSASATLALYPYGGAYGVNIASTLYQGGTEWKGHKLSDVSGEPQKYYSDEHIIASGGAFDIKSGDIKASSYTISATCPNGFYFRSQANPKFIRPFEILIIPRFDNGADKNNQFSGTPIRLTDTGQSVTVNWHEDAVDNKMWFDIVLVLPFDKEPVQGTNYIEAKGERYSLANAEDYTALVTLTMTYTDSDGTVPETLTIPFSGYYNGIIDSGRNNQRVSVMFTPSGNAGNLNIQEHQNQEIHVGSVDLLLDATTGNSDGVYGQNQKRHSDDYVKIFLSSSSNPNDESASIFRFVHSSITPNTMLTNYNSIGYKLIVTGDEFGGASYHEFDGTDHLDANKDISNAIIPEHEFDTAYTLGKEYSREYFVYHGDISVRINPVVTTMLAGTYSSDVYIHVVTEEGGGL